MSDRESKAREARYARMVKALHAAVAAMETVIAHDPITANSTASMNRLRREMAEFASYLDQATWWRVKQ